ncbi:MAG TPA: hypothetical protein VFG56_02600, partial [Candidatus Saccharimonadales bacterium]|nr:hypothetical protein [Candidatus Saccharimonadales bacterium]
MNLTEDKDNLNAIAPGVVEAYAKLKSTDGMGIYTSAGRFYNHTLFGRDASMSAKFVADFDHQVAVDTIMALAALQGTKTDSVTQEEPGRVHHELRDFTTWHGAWPERLMLRFFKSQWGAQNDQLLTYFSVDSTASFVRLINKYAYHIDKSILSRKVTNHHDEVVTVEQSLAEAADWLTRQIDTLGHFAPKRTNRRSLPFQIYEDSPTSYIRQDGSLLNYKRPIAYASAQIFACDALEDASKLLPKHPRRHVWQDAAHQLRDSFIRDFWQEKQAYFASAIDSYGQSNLDSVSIGWTLNNGLWDELDKGLRAEKIGAIVRRLFSNGFLTKVGLRTRAIDLPQPLNGTLEYHDADAVWPMFTFMVIEGLRRHKLYRLAEQLENRLLNGINAMGNFPEFIDVDKDGRILRPVNRGEKHDFSVKAQMRPEECIAFTVVPSLTLARRIANGNQPKPLTKGWQKELEDEILSGIDSVDLAEPTKAEDAIGTVVPIKLNRLAGNLRTVWFFLKESRNLK